MTTAMTTAATTLPDEVSPQWAAITTAITTLITVLRARIATLKMAGSRATADLNAAATHRALLAAPSELFPIGPLVPVKPA
jgi:hypothetical protein